MVKTKESLGFFGIKQGMMQLFDSKGNKVVCTLISTEPHLISQIKTVEKDGYSSIQLAGIAPRASAKKHVSKPVEGHFKKSGLEPKLKIKEVRLQEHSYQLGQVLEWKDVFKEGDLVDVQGVSKGKGHQGVMKRHNFAGGPAAHGSGFHRHGGSCGMRSTPGRCLPGQKKSGHMGAEQVTVNNLRVVKLQENSILVEGAVPGSAGSYVWVRAANKVHQKG